METVFGTVLIVIVIVAMLVAMGAYIGTSELYDRIGKSDMVFDSDPDGMGPAPGSAAYDAEALADARQMIEAKSERLVARGEPPLDVEAELERLRELTAGPSSVDPEILDEVRALVHMRNIRRAGRGEELLDVEAEVEREIRELGL